MKNLLTLFFILITTAVFGQTKFVHTTSIRNISANSSFLDVDGLNGNPNAIIVVEYDALARTANPHPVGVWYNGSKWAVFNQDIATMPAGLTFSITWKNADANSFSQKASANTLNNGKFVLNHPALNNKPAASFYVSQNYNPGGLGGVYNNADITVEYDIGLARWLVKNVNGSSIPDGAAFNMLVVANNSAANVSINPAIINNLPAVVNNPGTVINTTPANNNSVTHIDPAILAAAQNFTNTDFEFGLSKWTATGTAFSNQPVQGNTVTSERVLLGMKYDNGGIGGDYWKGIVYPIGIKNDFWIGTYEKGNGDASTGTLTSSPIKITNRYLHFLLGGGNDINKLYVELQVKKSDYEAAWGAGKRSVWGETADGFARVSRVTSLLNTEELYRYWFDLDAELNHQFANKTIRIEIIDNSSRSWGHINADDFQQSDYLTDFIFISKDGFNLYADKDKPVFGFADLHAHWSNHIGLHGLMHGTPGGNWQTSNPLTDIPPCDGFNHGLPTITPGLLVAQTESAAMNRWTERMFGDFGNSLCAGLNLPNIITGGYLALQAASYGTLDAALTTFLYSNAPFPAFQACGYALTKDVFAKHYNNNFPENNTQISNYVDYPKWNTMFHQLMHITWVRRSWQGGQRLMLVPVGTAKSWEFNTTAGGDFKDQALLIEMHVTYLKKLARENNDWMEIAYTPKQARQIILNGKMAIVLGLEQAEVGNYGFVSPAVEVNWLHNLGIRHVYPIHNIDNKIGGASIFNSALTSYNDLVNRRSQNDPIVPFTVRDGYDDPVNYVSVKLSRSFMRQGIRYLPIVGFGNIPFFYLNDVPAYQNFQYHKNALGLLSKGENYIKELMKKGMLIDVDHMSDLAQQSTMELMKQYSYPMMSGHANFRELRWNEKETSNKEAKMRTEFTLTDSRVPEIYAAGGMIGIMTQQNDTKKANGCPVPNNSAGGSPSFSQAYWYALQKTGNEKGIAFGSDFNGFAPQTTPRFGVDAAYFLDGDDLRNVASWRPIENEDKLRREHAFQQKNGVRYDTSINTYHYHRFSKPAFLTSEEREIWEALAIAKSGIDPEVSWQPGGGGLFGLTDPVRTSLQINKIKNLAHGFRTASNNIQWLDCPDYGLLKGDCPPEREAAFMCVNGTAGRDLFQNTRLNILYRRVKPIYDLWMQFEKGPNEKLRRSFAYPGGRDFDFNLDGLAHYGMFPDLIQDMKNNGLSAEQLKPLFLAPEEFIRMWEKADAAKNTIHN